MAELLPFNTAAEPFVRVELDGDRFLVRFENCPRFSGQERRFTVGMEAVRHGMSLALREDLPLLLWPRLLGHLG